MLSVNVATAMANANVPYHTYNYDYWEDIYYTPAAYVPNGNISGTKLDIGVLNSPQDIFVGTDERVYVADTGNNRIVVLDKNMKLERIIDSFDNEGVVDTFNAPNGICVTVNNEIYLADTDNLRVVALNEDGSLLKIIS
ncbi:MAG: gluconolactonase, partial [Clostridiales bacterium]|nr:gluconolactonase [Clostridiales bacterium]